MFRAQKDTLSEIKATDLKQYISIGFALYNTYEVYLILLIKRMFNEAHCCNSKIFSSFLERVSSIISLNSIAYYPKIN